jgi:hypothetical protein
VVLADFSNDGNLDVAVGGGAGVDVYLGNGGRLGSMVWTPASVGLPRDKFSGLTASDWNNDGLMDLVVSAYGAGSGVGIRAYENTRNAALWTSASEGLPTSGDYIENAVEDVNGDGHMDIVTAGSYGSSYGVKVYHGDGKGSWTDNATGFSTNVQYVGVDVGDIDHDDTLDILVGKRSRGGGLEVWKNPSSAPPPRPDLVLDTLTGGDSLTGGSTHQVSWTTESGTTPFTANVRYSIDSGATFPYIIASDVEQTEEGTTNIDWDVPTEDLANLRVQVEIIDARGLKIIRSSNSDLELDSTAPTVSTTFPRDEASDVSTGTPVIITFSEGMETTSTEDITIEGPGSPGVANPSWSGTQLTMDTSGLQGGSLYTITVGTGVVDDSDPGNAMVTDHVLSFTTGAGNTPVPPTVVSISPDHDATGVGIGTDITIGFSKAMDRTATTAAISSSPAVEWSVQWASGDTQATIVPNAELMPNTRYTLSIATEAMASDGTTLDSIYSFGFTTGDPPDRTRPEVLDSSPYDRAVDVDPGTAVTIIFSEAMDRATTEAAISLSPGYIEEFVWSEGDTVLTLVMDLEEGRMHAITVGTGATDMASNRLELSFSYSFTVKASEYEEPAGLGYPLAPLLLVAMLVATLAAVVRRKSED